MNLFDVVKKLMGNVKNAIRIIDRDQVVQLLSFSECVEVVRDAMIATSERRVSLP